MSHASTLARWLPGPRPCFAPQGKTLCRRDVDRLVEFVQGAGNLVCLTGAGFSTESGVPDYRSPMGSYSKGHKPMTHKEFVGSTHQRKRYWARSLAGWRFFDSAGPNAAHHALASLESSGHVSGVITQNVDGLHHKGGSKRVIELHGRNDELECMKCGSRRPRKGFQAELEKINACWISEHLGVEDRSVDVRADGDAHIATENFESFRVPACVCGGEWKPTVVFFGGSLQSHIRDEASQLVESASRLMILGSSCQVFSAYRLVKAAHEAGKTIVLVNIGPTRVDPFVIGHRAFSYRCGAVLSAVVAQLARSD